MPNVESALYYFLLPEIASGSGEQVCKLKCNRKMRTRFNWSSVSFDWESILMSSRNGEVQRCIRPLSVPFLLRTSGNLTVKLARLAMHQMEEKDVCVKNSSARITSSFSLYSFYVVGDLKREIDTREMEGMG